MDEEGKFNAICHDSYKIVGLGYASVGQFIVAWISPPIGEVKAPKVIGIGMAAFGHDVALKYHQEAIDRIKIFQDGLHELA